MARPPKYCKEFAVQAFKLCLLGATDVEIADFFEVDERTVNRWKVAHKEFCQALKEGKMAADARVASRLYERAMGYEHPEDKIFNNNGSPLVVPTVKHYPPDTTAAIFWLKNRQRAKWRDKQDHEHTGKDGAPIESKVTYTNFPPEPKTIEEWQAQVEEAEAARRRE